MTKSSLDGWQCCMRTRTKKQAINTAATYRKDKYWSARIVNIQDTTYPFEVWIRRNPLRANWR